MQLGIRCNVQCHMLKCTTTLGTVFCRVVQSHGSAFVHRFCYLQNCIPVILESQSKVSIVPRGRVEGTLAVCLAEILGKHYLWTWKLLPHNNTTSIWSRESAPWLWLYSQQSVLRLRFFTNQVFHYHFLLVQSFTAVEEPTWHRWSGSTNENAGWWV